jgi:nicotinamidase-related amidase
MGKKALIIVDLQNDYFAGGKWTLEGIDDAAANAARLIADARARGDKIVHVRHEFPVVEAPFFAPGSEGADIHESVRPADGETVVTKQQVNCFRDTDLKRILDDEGVEDVVICGAMSHMCVDAAARAAADFGYGVTLIHDACASRDIEHEGVTVPAKYAHAAFMSALGFAYADARSTDAYLGS